MTPISHGYKISDVVVPPQAFTAAELEDAMYRLTADPDQDALLLESCDLEEADALMNPGQDMVVEAVTAVKNRLDRTMNALVRVFRRYSSSVEPHEYPSIGPDRRNALFAYKTVTFTFKDGQTVSILFHSPGRDPMKLRADDTLIAYRWMLNRRDITATVAPERGRDINLQTMARRIMQLVEDNSERFQANNQARQEQQEKLAELEGEQQEVSQRVEALTQQNADLSGNIEQADETIARLRERLAAMGEDEREGSGAGTGSTGTPESEREGPHGLSGSLAAVRDGGSPRRQRDLYDIARYQSILDQAGVSYPSAEEFMGMVARGERQGFSVKSLQDKLAEHEKDLSDLQAGRIRGDRIVGRGNGGKPAAIKWLKEKIAETSSSLESGGIGNGVNLGNYRGLLGDMVRDMPGEAGAEAGSGQSDANTLTADSVSDALLAALRADGGFRSAAIQAQSRVSSDMYESHAYMLATQFYERFGQQHMPEGVDSMDIGEKMRVQEAFRSKAIPYLVGIMRDEASAAPGPSPESGRVADYLARVAAAQTAKEVGAIAIELERDPDLSVEDDRRISQAIRQRRIDIEQASREATIPTDDNGIPEGFKEVARYFNSDNEEVAAYAQFAEGDTVAMRSNAALTGEVVGHVGSGPVIREHLVRWSNGVESRLHHTDLQAAEAGGDTTSEPDNLEALDGRVYRDMVRSIAEVRSIDNGESPMNRSAFTTNMANRLRTQARNGNTEVVDAALLLLAEQSLAHGRPILAARNRIWSATGNDMDYYMEIARRRAEASAGTDTGTPDGAGSDDFAPGFSSRNFESQEAAEEALTAAGYSHNDMDYYMARFFSASGRNEVVVNPALGGQWQVMELDDSSGDPAPDDSGPTEQDRITADLTALIDTETDARAFDERLTDLTRRAEEAGAMEALMSQFNQAADRLDALLDAAEQGGGSAGGDAAEGGDAATGGEQPAGEQQQIEDGLQALIDSESDASAFDAALDEWAERAEAAGLMDALDAKLNEAADRLTTLLNEEAARVA